MAYTYEVEIRLKTNQKHFKLEEKEGPLRDAIQRYNDRSSEMQNPKTLILKELHNDCMLLTLESVLPLNSVGRALRTFSIILIKEIKDPDFISAIAPNGQLFSTTQTKNNQKIPMESNDNDIPINDLDVIKALMDYIYKKRDPDSTIYRRKRAAFEQIKKIALESGIIKTRSQNN